MKSAISADALNGWSPNPSVLALAFRALLGTYLFRYHLSKLFARVSYERVLEVQRTIFLLDLQMLLERNQQPARVR